MKKRFKGGIQGLPEMSECFAETRILTLAFSSWEPSLAPAILMPRFTMLSALEKMIPSVTVPGFPVLAHPRSQPLDQNLEPCPSSGPLRKSNQFRLEL